MTSDLRSGMLITNGTSALELTHRVDRDPRWKVAGWRGYCIGLEQYGGNVGYTEFVPDYLLGSWRPMPLEWTPVAGGGLEERYVRREGSPGRMRREVRRAGADQD
jgi:hypothetical protein